MGIHFILDKQHNVVTAVSIQVAKNNVRLFIGPVVTLVQWSGGFENGNLKTFKGQR